MSGELLYGVNEWVLFVLSALLLYAGAEVGYRYGRRHSERISVELRSHVSTVEGALLGLLALLLGFAFAMAMNRYDARRQTVLDEVNDLRTCYLRAGLLPPKRAAAVRALLREYAGVRQADLRGEDVAEARTLALQHLLWEEAEAATRDDSDEVRTGYFIESLNRVFDDDTTRSAALRNHVPESILLLLALVAFLTLAVTGYSSGLRRRRLLGLRSILVLLIAATLLVIIDLDRPRRGLIRVSETGMADLKSEFDTWPKGGK